MRVMRLVTGFLLSLPNIKSHERIAAFEIQPDSNWRWFFLRRKQLFLVFQEPIHIAMKWRNRLLSRATKLIVGKYNISIEHLKLIL